MTKRILVTGAAGFIGSSLCERLVRDGHRVVAVDNLFRGRREHLSALEEVHDFYFIEGDVREESVLNACEAIFGGFDLVHHLAAINGTRWFHEAARDVIDVNINATLSTLAAAERWNARYVFASSPEAFGEEEVMPLSERTSTTFPSAHEHQRHSYGGSKYLGEVALQHAVGAGLDARIVRPFNAYGSRLLGEAYGQVIGMMFQAVKLKQAVQIHGDGSQTRCFTHIDDVVNGFILAGELDVGLLHGQPLAGCSFNIGSTEEISIAELARCIKAAVDDAGIEVIHSEGYYGDSKRRVPDCVAAEQLLGWHCTTKLGPGLKRVWREFDVQP